MKKLIDIIEGLKINSKTKVNTKEPLRDVSSANISGIDRDTRTKTPAQSEAHWKKMEYYFNKKSDPKRLANSIKDDKKLLIRWEIAVAIGWLECATVFRQTIVNRGYYTEDQLDNYIVRNYNIVKNSKNSTAIERCKNYKEYLDEFNVKYDNV